MATIITRPVNKFFDQKIDSYENVNQFEITKGDKKALIENSLKNKKITRTLIIRIITVIMATIISFFIEKVIQSLIN